MKKMFNEGNQIHNLISSSGSGTVINYGSGSDFLTSYGSGYGSGSTSQKVTAPTVPVPVPVPQHCFNLKKKRARTVATMCLISWTGFLICSWTNSRKAWAERWPRYSFLPSWPFWTYLRVGYLVMWKRVPSEGCESQSTRPTSTDCPASCNKE